MGLVQRARMYGDVRISVVIDPQSQAGIALSNEYALSAGCSESVCDPNDYPCAYGEGTTYTEAMKAAIADARRLGFERNN